MKQSGKISAFAMVLIIMAIVGVLGAAGWVVWQHLVKDSKDLIVDSYQACVDAGNPIMESYPSVCATKDGKRFVNPDHKIN